MAQVQDARVLMVLKDAAEMRDFRERQAKLKEKEKAAAPMPPPTSSPERRPSTAERERTTRRDQLSRLSKTGSAREGEKFLSEWVHPLDR
jgi:predicted flap endonuclease-1-like 5' DNA nuclease